MWIFRGIIILYFFYHSNSNMRTRSYLNYSEHSSSSTRPAVGCVQVCMDVARELGLSGTLTADWPASLPKTSQAAIPRDSGKGMTTDLEIKDKSKASLKLWLIEYTFVVGMKPSSSFSSSKCYVWYITTNMII